MRVFWWQATLHLEPRTDEEMEALKNLEKVLTGFGLGLDARLPDYKVPLECRVRPEDFPGVGFKRAAPET